MNGSGNVKRDIVFALAIIAFSVLIYWQSLGLPPPRYEPMGSAALPKALSVIMSLLALIVLFRALRDFRARSHESAVDLVPEPSPSQINAQVTARPWLAVFAFLVTAGYVAVLDNKLIGYPIATIAYVSITCLVLSRFKWRQSHWIVLFATVLSIACYLIFTRIFYIDLP